MDDGSATPTPLPTTTTTTTQPRLLRRRSNSYSKSVVNLSFNHHRLSPPLSSWSSSGVDTDSVPIIIKPSSYTSIKDLLPSTAVNSPKPNSPTQSEIFIKNHLVKQAAFAYLQPMSSTRDATGSNFFHRIWIKLLVSNPVSSLRNFFDVHVFRRVSHAFDWLLQTVCLRGSR